MGKTITVCAGIDTGKHKLDVAIEGSAEQLQVDNKRHGHRSLSIWLRRHGVGRIGIEASGGYEQEVVAWLRAQGLAVDVLQPAQVRAYARFVLQHAKNDKIDAALIARCTAEKGGCREAPDARLAQLAQHLTMIEQLTGDIARLKTRCESCRERRILQVWRQQIADLKDLLKGELKQLVAAIREHGDLADRLHLIASVKGVGLRTAIAILVRLPEIGRVSREQVAALAGLAPYDNDSGLRRGSRHIKGGRQRLRKSLYAAALPAAFYWNAELKTLYARLIAAGKPHKLALIACARKLLIFVNTVVARGTPWTPSTAAA